MPFTADHDIDMSFYFAQLFGAAAVYEGARRTILNSFRQDVHRYSGTNVQISMEMLIVHLAHASTLSTKAQFCTWFLTFVSQAYQGEAAAVATKLIMELRDMDDVAEEGPAQVQAGMGRDVEAECLAFMAAHPAGGSNLCSGDFFEVQASWEQFRQGYSFGIDCFKSLRHSTIYAHLRKIIAACLAGTFFSERLFKEHKGFHRRLFEGVDKHDGMDFVDILDEVLDLSRLVFDAATLCVQTKSFGPLLGRGAEVYALDTEHAWLTAHQEYYEIGSLFPVTTAAGKPVTDEEYVLRVERHLEKIKKYHAGSVGAERLIMQRRLTDALKWNTVIQLNSSRASLRREPYSVFMYGPTAQGKTVTCTSIVKLLLQINGFPYKQDVISYVDAQSKYMDTVQNSTMGIIMDDVANTRPQFQQCDPLAQFIAANNTSNAPVSRADVDSKGKITHHCAILAVSSNVPDLNAMETSKEPSAIPRRFKLALEVSVHPDFIKTYNSTTVAGFEGMQSLGMLDPAKLKDGLYSDHQRFRIMEWVPFARTQAHPEDKGNWFTVVHEGRVMQDLHMDEMMRYAAWHSKRHFNSQTDLLAAHKADEDLPICPHGGVTAPWCRECRRISRGESEEEVQAGDGITDFFFPRPGDERSVRLGNSASSDEFIISDAASASTDYSPAQSVQDSVPTLDTPRTFRERFAAHRRVQQFRDVWHRATVPEPPPEAPPLLGWLKAWSHGVLDIERLAYTHFDAVMLGLLSVAPAAAFMSSSLMALLGAGWAMTTFTGLVTFGYTGVTMSRNGRGWISARVAGATLQELRSRAYDMAKSSFGVLAGIIGMLALIQGLRKLTAYATAPEECSACDARIEYAKRWAKEAEEHKHVCEAKGADRPSLGEYEREPIPGKLIHTCPGPRGYKEVDVQGGAESRPPAMPDPIPRNNAWEKRDIELQYHTYGPTRNMTAEQIYMKLSAQLYVLDIEYASKVTTRSNCFIPATNYLVAPAHNFLTRSGEWAKIVSVTVRRTTELRGPSFPVKISPEQMYRMPGDCMLVQINAGGTMPFVSDLIADTMPQVSFGGLELYRNTDTCEVERSGYLVTPEAITCPEYGMGYWGMSYVRPQPTFRGLCGALVITASRYPKVTGFHTMGVAGKGRGVACCFTRGDIQEGIEILRKQALLSCPVVVQNTTDPYTPHGMEAEGLLGPLSDMAAVKSTPAGTTVIVRGTLVNHRHSKAKSDLVVSDFSPIVAAECGELRKHEAPRNIGKATVEVAKLKEMADRTSLNPQDMALAKRDMYEDLRALVVSLGFGVYFVVHTIAEACSGVAGAATFRSINRGTAAGWPFLGDKKKHLVDSPREGLPDAFTLTPQNEADLREVEGRMENLERVNLMFKGSHKSEPVKIGKEKVRVFEGSPLLLTVLFRMYFMPIIRLYLLARLETGSAVGIDATSSEWDTMFSFFTEFNPTEAIVGDWQHFDTSQAYQEMMAVFCIWIDIMSEFGTYTQAQINVMWVIAEEICRHYALFRGDVVQTEGTNPSGGAGTVYINNPVGGLRFAAAFYGMAREQGAVTCGDRVEYRPGTLTSGGLRVQVNGRAGLEPLLPNLDGRYMDYVRTMLYGDDFVHAPKPIVVPWYNQITLHAYFAKEGMHLTDANKGPFTSPTTQWGEVTFLKRHFRRDEDTGCVMAPLEMDSIYKCMHVWTKKLAWAPEVHAAQLVGGAVRELFQHGRAVYEERVPRLLRAAERYGSLPYLAEQVTSYDAMRAEWMGRELQDLALFEAHRPPSE